MVSLQILCNPTQDLLGLVMSAEEEADEQPDERGAAAPAAGDGKEGKTNGRASTAAAPARQVQGRSRGAIADWGEDDEDAGGDGEDVVPPGRRHGAAAGGGSGPVRSSPAAPVEGRRGGGGPMEADEDDESAQYEELLAMQEASQGSAERRRQAEEDAALEAVGPDWGWEDEEGVPAPAAPAPARPAAAGSQQGGGHAAAAVGRAAPGGRLSRRSQQSAFVGSDDAMQEDGLEDGMEDGMEGAGTGAAAAAAGAGRGSGSLEDATMPSAAEKSDSDRDVDEELVARLLDDADDAGGAEEDQEVEVKAGVRGRTALPSQAPRGASQGGAGRARQVLMDDDDD